MAAKYNVSGFIYTDEATAKIAAKEEKAVAYLRPQIKWNNPTALLGGYNQLLDQKLFHTQVGLSFLGEIREALLNNPEIDNSLVRPIDTTTLMAKVSAEIKPDNTQPIPKKRTNTSGERPIKNEVLEEASERAQTEALIKAKPHNQKLVTKELSKEIPIEESDIRKVRRLTAENKKYRLMSLVFGVATAVLTIAVIGMFYINSTINSPNILNYEEKIIDKYAAWEQSLTERERALIINNNQMNN